MTTLYATIMPANFIATYGGTIIALGVPILIAAFKRRELWDFVKTRLALTAERDAAFAQVGEYQKIVLGAREALSLHSSTIAALVASHTDSIERINRLDLQLAESHRNTGTLLDRINELEDVRPLYDAFVLWVPAVLEYVAWIELQAKHDHVDLGDRDMPPLPTVLVAHFAERKL